MNYKNILVTGGAGFVGSQVCISLKKHYPSISVTALDNLMRRGSEMNVPRLQKYGITFVHGDVRSKEDLDIGKVDLIIECSAEPSVMAGVTSSPEYLLNTNLVGAINCFELARKKDADVVFLSTSRVYPVKQINQLKIIEEETRFALSDQQKIVGASKEGISEQFPLEGVRSLYGTTKLAAELVLQEYAENYGIKAVINRFGLITGPWQMGKVDQGVIVLWMAKHMFNKQLSYIGFAGTGKQVRDAIHVDDVFDIVNIQINSLSKFNKEIYNIGGGRKNSVSLVELTGLCQEISGKKIKIQKVDQNRPGDIKVYITDNKKIYDKIGWQPKRSLKKTLHEIHEWIDEHKEQLENILS
jgi:CDP-paratose 2-epimerase